MKVDIAWWDLDGSGQTVDSLGRHLREGAVDPWTDVDGLRLKLWIADRTANRWGALMIWESYPPASTALPPNRAAELIGAQPTYRQRFEVEAAVEGAHSGSPLHWLGSALAGGGTPDA